MFGLVCFSQAFRPNRVGFFIVLFGSSWFGFVAEYRRFVVDTLFGFRLIIVLVAVQKKINQNVNKLVRTSIFKEIYMTVNPLFYLYKFIIYSYGRPYHKRVGLGYGLAGSAGSCRSWYAISG